jgi:NADH-quinone oxidoreductase subunit L
MPITFGVMAVSWAAIIGLPPFAGFFSKDLIIEQAFDQRGVLGDHGRPSPAGRRHHGVLHDPPDAHDLLRRARWTDDVHPHESPRVMTGPMVLLGVGSVVSASCSSRLLARALPRAGARRAGPTTSSSRSSSAS